MSPTAETLPVGSRTSVTMSTRHSFHENEEPVTAIQAESMMHGDHDQSNGFSKGQKSSPSKLDFYYKEPCLYSHKVYLNASKVFSVLRHETEQEVQNSFLKKRQQQENTNKVILPDFDFDDDAEKRLTFELAYETLKYQMVFEDLLSECAFFSQYPEFVEEKSLVMVVLWDYQHRKFQQRTPFPGELLEPTVTEVEEAITEYKTKLNASLARHRIKASAPSVEFLLPDKVRSKEEIGSKLPVYVWINQLKISISEALEKLKDDSYVHVSQGGEFEGRVFSVDCHCNDVLVFPPECREDIQQHEMLNAGQLVMQDKSSCIAPHSVKYLISDDDDIIHVNAGSCVTTAHLASLMNKSSGHIWAFGANKEAGSSKVHRQFEKLGATKCIKLLHEQFLETETDDSRFKNAKVVLVSAECSKSGINNPVDFIVNEGEDMKILKDLSIGETDLTKIGELMAQHSAILKHAMKLHKVHAVVYMTRSIHEAENENVVMKAVEYINAVQQRKFPYRVVPPVLPFSGEDIDKSIGISGKYIKFKPSEKNSGCFVAVITREPEDAKEATKDVLARAAAKGLLGGGKKTKEPKLPVPVAEQNGDMQVNGEPSEFVPEVQEEKKLLKRRTKKAPHKVRSAPHPTYHKPSGTSIVREQILGGPPIRVHHRPSRSPTQITSRLYATRTKSLGTNVVKSEKKDIVPEYVKVVKHPAPFRAAKQKCKPREPRDT